MINKTCIVEFDYRDYLYTFSCNHYRTTRDCMKNKIYCPYCLGKIEIKIIKEQL